jgi:ATP-dependent exoDNAse (exonuclease V) beta subunit
MPDWTDMQKRALEESGNLLVSASAGSGKTSVMAQKVINYLLFFGDGGCRQADCHHVYQSRRRGAEIQDYRKSL